MSPLVEASVVRLNKAVLPALFTLATLCCGGERPLGDYPASSCDLAEHVAPEEPADLKVTTFWEPRELAALDVLTNALDWREFTPSQTYELSRQDLQRALELNASAGERASAPDVFQVNGGSDVLRWVAGRRSAQSGVCPLDRLRDEGDWRSRYFEAALTPSSCNDALFALPVGIHRLNLLFYNTELYARLVALARERDVELPPLTSVDSARELVKVVRAVQALGVSDTAGHPLIEFSIGIRRTAWPLTTLAFENVFLSLGSEGYEWLWKGGLAEGSRERARLLSGQIRETLEILRQLESFSGGAHDLPWQDSLRAVAKGDALMTVSGDWGWRQLVDVPHASVEAIPFPGTTGIFVYTPDSFAASRVYNRNNGAPVRAFLVDAVSDRSTLIDFSKVKQAIPPVRDLSPAELDELGEPRLRDSYSTFARCAEGADGCRLLLATSGLGPGAGADACFDQIGDLLAVAVTGSPSDTNYGGGAAQCAAPETMAGAEEALQALLQGVASRPFAAECGER